VTDATGAKSPGLRDADGSAFRATTRSSSSPLAKTDLVLDIADRCSSKDPAALCATQVVDAVFLGRTESSLRPSGRSRETAALDYRETTRAHQWYWWSQQLRDHQLPFLLARLASPSKG